MDAIKKKMQAMKLDKDGAMERALQSEQQARDANLRAEKVCNHLLIFLMN
jgi:tropomyosin 1